MHLGRFHAVIYDLAHHFKGAELSAKVESCVAQLDQYAASRAQAQLEAFRAALETLLKASEVKDQNLSQPFAQQVIAELGLSDILSPLFEQKINKAIAERSFDPIGLAAELRQIGAKATEKIAQIRAIDTAFRELDVEFERVENTAAEVGLMLPREIVGDNLGSLTTEFNDIGKLARAISEMVGATEYDPKVITIASSWWQVFLDLNPDAILVWVFAIERIVNLFKSNLEIKNLQRQLSEKEISKDITDLIQREIDRRVSEGLRDLASELRASYATLDDTARLNEIETQLRQGLYYLAKRLNQGAQVEINVAVPLEPQDDNAEASAAAPTEEMTAKIEATRSQIAKLRDLRARARNASAETLTFDKSAPLLLASGPASEASPESTAKDD